MMELNCNLIASLPSICFTLKVYKGETEKTEENIVLHDIFWFSYELLHH